MILTALIRKCNRRRYENTELSENAIKYEENDRLLTLDFMKQMSVGYETER